MTPEHEPDRHEPTSFARDIGAALKGEARTGVRFAVWSAAFGALTLAAFGGWYFGWIGAMVGVGVGAIAGGVAAAFLFLDA